MARQLDLFSTTKEEWLSLAREVAHRVIREKGVVTADDIHERLPIPRYIDPRIMGSVFAGMRCVGYIQSKRTECHRRPIGLFTTSNNQRDTYVANTGRKII